MAVNRLDDMRKLTQPYSDLAGTQSFAEVQSDPDRANYLIQMDQVRTKFVEFDGITDRIGTLSDRLETCTTQKDFKRVHSSFRDAIQKANQLIKVIKSQIDALEVSNNDFETKNGDSREVEVSFRKVTWAGFSNRLRSSLVSFNRSQSRFESVYDKRTGERGFNPDLTLDLSPGDKESRVQQAFAQASREEGMIKREDMRRLEKSMREIREVFLQIAALVESQGEMLDCIEYSMVNAKNYAHQANVQLIQARKKQRQKTWIWFCCIFFLLVALAGIALGIWKLVQDAAKKK